MASARISVNTTRAVSGGAPSRCQKSEGDAGSVSRDVARARARAAAAGRARRARRRPRGRAASRGAAAGTRSACCAPRASGCAASAWAVASQATHVGVGRVPPRRAARRAGAARTRNAAARARARRDADLDVASACSGWFGRPAGAAVKRFTPRPAGRAAGAPPRARRGPPGRPRPRARCGRPRAIRLAGGLARPGCGTAAASKSWGTSRVLSRRCAVTATSPTTVYFMRSASPTLPATAGPVCRPIFAAQRRQPARRSVSFRRGSSRAIAQAQAAALRASAAISSCVARGIGTPKQALMPSPK